MINIPPSAGIVCEEGSILAGCWEAAEEEIRFAEKFGPKRRREFLTGRTYARRALCRLTGIAPTPPTPLLLGADRCPLWPEGVIGSIAHTDDYCAVIVAQASTADSIGLDVEALARVQENIREKVCTRSELDGLDVAALATRQRRLALIFSAKEAFYKMQHALTKSWLGFQDVTVTFPADGCFTVELLTNAGAVFNKGKEFSGNYAFTPVHVGTWMALKNS